MKYDPRESAAAPADSSQEASFAETALKLGGKSAEEAQRTGAVDRADDQVEALFAPRYQTVNSPVHRAVWDRTFPLELFQSASQETPEKARQVMQDSLQVARRHREANSLLDDQGKIAEHVLRELGECGYWGLLVSQDYGGSGAPFASFGTFLTEMSLQDPTVAGLASVHGCIGAVDPVRTFGTPEQKERFLPKLASGERLSAFALTEPGAGSDLTALSTTATLDGDSYVVNGEKLFITNVTPGRTIGLVCLIEDRPAVLIVDLPDEENDQFQLKKYGLYALKRTYNRGIVFRDFRVPAENLLTPPKGDGLTIAYHGLNLGRVALCATAAGNMRIMLASMLPWAKYRETYGAPIATRELVQRRIARLTGFIVAADALVQWCAGLIDEGYRGEMECVVAKIFGSEAQKEAAIELFMKTHGGRSFLHGHLFGDHVHEYLAPCIYEGEGEMLGMAFFKSLVKQHGKQFFEPIGKALQSAGIRQPSPWNPRHAWLLKGALIPYAKWLTRETLARPRKAALPPMPAALRGYAEFAAQQLQRGRLEVSSAMRRHQLALADRQCRMSQLSHRLQTAICMLCTSLYAARQEDEIIRQAAEVMCRELQAQLTGEALGDRDFRAQRKLGEAVAEGGFSSIANLHPDEILMPYK